MKIGLLGWFPAILLILYSSLSFAEVKSLYERIGGEAVVKEVTVDTLQQMVNNPRVNQSFQKVNIEKLANKIAEHTCFIGNGGCTYTGDEIKLVHAGLNITETEFYAMVEALRSALDRNGVGEREKNELLRLLAPMKRDIVTK